MSINYETNELFRKLIVNILKLGKLKSKTIELLLDTEYEGLKGIQHYGIGFTHKSIDPINNYEVYEFKGDSTANNCLVWYFSDRFPHLNSPEHVKTLARLKINFGSKKTFYELGEKLGMWDFISASTETRTTKTKIKVGNRIQVVENNTIIDIKQTKKKSLLEDSFEAFIGITHTLIEKSIKKCSAFKTCYNIIKSLYDDIDIKLDHESLYDPKTRLKELFDKEVSKFGKWTKNNIQAVLYKNRGSEYGRWKVKVGYNVQSNVPHIDKLREMLDLYMYDEKMKGDMICPNYILEYIKDNFMEKNKPTYNFIPLGYGEASLKDDAEQEACKDAIYNLENMGYKF
jgi:dsRNA-specific ribonuclease|tara:strand:+ start:1738 stop:2766 length:1029 start_codon:yes stop_codon:yes gene_type:complete